MEILRPFAVNLSKLTTLRHACRRSREKGEENVGNEGVNSEHDSTVDSCPSGQLRNVPVVVQQTDANECLKRVNECNGDVTTVY